MSFRSISYLSILTIVAILSVLHFKKLSTPYRLLTGLIVFNWALEITSKILAQKFGNSIPIYHFVILGGLTFNLFIYLKIHVIKKASFIIIVGMTILFIILSVLNSLTNQTINVFPTNGIMLHGLQSITFSLIVYLNMLQYPIQASIFKQPVFWLNTGNFVFYGITFTIFALYNFFYKSSYITSYAHWFIYGANLFLYCSYLYAIILDSKTYHTRNGFR
ncbi:hypothetical protein DNU06_09455 [Putridiphycobacter roseus]|uniref:DUF998 domain-containing protein n=1 Tax=Putridiphycobacter roseus TaxID=2219161 RepID=A0A2W1MYM4_9FLAO|nr:hypothetical protein [Putridiphycobacter roseus]PZE16967.1 hypothetical protein DNU06_09455 [Putridiphycobacter roseus]